MRCKTCHCVLANLTGPPHRCPECGRGFDPRDPNTFEHAGSPKFWPTVLRQAGAMFGGVFLIVYLCRTSQVPANREFVGPGMLIAATATAVVFPLLLVTTRAALRRNPKWCKDVTK